MGAILLQAKDAEVAMLDGEAANIVYVQRSLTSLSGYDHSGSQQETNITMDVSNLTAVWNRLWTLSVCGCGGCPGDIESDWKGLWWVSSSSRQS